MEKGHKQYPRETPLLPTSLSVCLSPQSFSPLLRPRSPAPPPNPTRPPPRPTVRAQHVLLPLFNPNSGDYPSACARTTGQPKGAAFSFLPSREEGEGREGGFLATSVGRAWTMAAAAVAVEVEAGAERRRAATAAGEAQGARAEAVAAAAATTIRTTHSTTLAQRSPTTCNSSRSHSSSLGRSP